MRPSPNVAGKDANDYVERAGLLLTDMFGSQQEAASPLTGTNHDSEPAT